MYSIDAFSFSSAIQISPPCRVYRTRRKGGLAIDVKPNGWFHLTLFDAIRHQPLPVCHNSDRNHDVTALESRCVAFMILQWKTWAVVDAVLRGAESCQKEIDLC
jgi:hypothetical protein